MQDWLEKYAHLLVNYSLYLKPGERLFVRTSTLAEPLLKQVYLKALEAGAIVDWELGFEDQEKMLVHAGKEQQLDYIAAGYKTAMEQFDALLTIRAPHVSRQDFVAEPDKRKRRAEALQPYEQRYFQRLGDGSLKRCLCQYPTECGALHAGMSLDEYAGFIRNACFLNEEDPSAHWKELSRYQQRLVDFLDHRDRIIYRHPEFEISFSVKDRKWMNSDGKANMPSGEVFTSPVEDSVNGEIFFNYPSIYQDQEVEGIRLRVSHGAVVAWSAQKGGELLDRIFQLEGSRYFGEVAIGCNHNIRRPTKNILFDEKIGGTIHMAIGQSYLQTGGKNHSSIHWDMIAEMRNGGEIFADGELIYKDGAFLI
ncbi:MAG: Aminopeptidase 2 [Saprospiraceae bacterium]|jgi:aminopeptidase|nr:Aminopeptidase 2 [Saprospiraceae bacterium]